MKKISIILAFGLALLLAFAQNFALKRANSPQKIRIEGNADNSNLQH